LEPGYDRRPMGAPSATFREYVEAVWELQEEGVEPIQARIADWLGLSRPSVSEMVHRMEGEGLVVVEGGAVQLTKQGRYLAEVVVRRHRLSERFLAEVLKLPWVKVHEEASVWEHVISDDVEKAMWAALSNPQTCPHGNPIPGAGYKPPRMKPIANMAPGEDLRLERISEELEQDAEIMGLLDRSGMRPGARITRREGQISVDGGGLVTLDDHVAERVFVAI